MLQYYVLYVLQYSERYRAAHQEHMNRPYIIAPHLTILGAVLMYLLIPISPLYADDVQNKYTLTAHCTPVGESSKKCSFSILSSMFTFTPEGKGKRTDPTGKEIFFTIPLDEIDAIESMEYYVYNGDLILVYGVTDGDCAWGTAVRLDKDTYSVKWKIHIPGFNLTVGTIEGNILYQAAIGFVSSINLDTGEYNWKHSGLYDDNTGAFNSFNTPIITSEEVIFRSIHSTTKIVSTIKVNKQSGKVNKQSGKFTIEKIFSPPPLRP
jgi:hypothetical protein